MASMMALYDRLAHPYLWVRRMSVTAVHVRSQDIQDLFGKGSFCEQTSLLDGDPREARLQEAALESIADLAAMTLSRGATYAKKP